MSTQTTGRAALVANHLPTSVSVTGATNASPIVVTTSGAHLLQTNEIIAISGVGGNTAANGTFIAVVQTGTTVALLAYPTGANTTGSGGYTSGGTLQSLGFGVTVPVPNDGTDPEDAASVNVALEFLLDRTAWAAYQILGSSTIQGNKTFTGSPVTFTGLVNFQGGTEYRPRVLLSDAAHTIDVTADTYVLPNAPATTRLITLSTTAGSPQLGQRIRCIVPGLTYGGTAQLYQFTRSGLPAGLIAKAYASVTNITANPISVEFEFAPGLILVVTGTGSGSGGAVKLTLALPSGWGAALGNPTDSLATGDQVVVAGVGGTTEANGTWTITVNDGTHITLTGTTFVYAWTSGGTAQITPGTWRLGMNSGTSYDGSAQVGLLPDAAS